MNTKSAICSLLAFGGLSAAGFGMYQIGTRQSVDTVLLRSADAATESAQSTSAMEIVDPSNWGIPQGEAATRRHIKDGLKAGEVDPVTGRKVLYYHDPMVPGKKFDAPSKSPFMDMMLVPAYSGAAGADDSTITVSPRIQQNLGLRIGEVVEGTLAMQVLAVGAIEWNERDQALVQARAMGYVEKLHVRATLDRVSKGQALFDLYVPDWVAVQEDYLSVRRMQGNDLDALLDATRQRMRQAGMSSAQIALVERKGVVQARMTIAAPIDGVLTELSVRDGSTVMPGMTLVRVNGLSTVWAEAHVAESQASQLRVGASISARSPALPGSEFDGVVQTLLPQVNVSTRTLRVRTELNNPQGQLVPGMFVQMTLNGPGQGETLLVPTEALIYTGQRVLVMAVEADGSFRPVEVETGAEANGETEIRRGLQIGQKIVLSGQFLIDSEASLKGVEARAGGSDPAGASNSYRTWAKIEAISDDALTLSHPEIPSLKWPAMTMNFSLEPGLKKPPPLLKIGQSIEIEFRMQDGAPPQIFSIQPAKDQGSLQ